MTSDPTLSRPLPPATDPRDDLVVQLRDDLRYARAEIDRLYALVERLSGAAQPPPAEVEAPPPPATGSLITRRTMGLLMRMGIMPLIIIAGMVVLFAFPK